MDTEKGHNYGICKLCHKNNYITELEMETSLSIQHLLSILNITMRLDLNYALHLHPRLENYYHFQILSFVKNRQYRICGMAKINQRNSGILRRKKGTEGL